MRKLVILGILIFSLSQSDVQAQQAAMISQFVMNAANINPGYVGYRELQSINLVHRSQWVGFEGAPATDVISFDMALENKRSIAVGGSLERDKIGPTTQLSFTGAFAYRLQFDEKKVLSLGLQGYAGLIQADFSNLIVGSHLYEQIIEDAAVVNNPENVFLPNVGFGAFFHTPDLFVGLSAPRMVNNKIKDKAVSTIISQGAKIKPAYFLMGGKNFTLNDACDIQPALLVRYTVGAPTSIGMNLNLLVGEHMKVGAFYNYREVVGAMFQYRVSQRTRLGYAFDVSTHTLVKTNFGSHEISAAYVFRDLKRKIVYPRKF